VWCEAANDREIELKAVTRQRVTVHWSGLERTTDVPRGTTEKRMREVAADAQGLSEVENPEVRRGGIELMIVTVRQERVAGTTTYPIRPTKTQKKVRVS
jgi:hypothetical protein